MIFFFQILLLNTLNANSKLYFLPAQDNIAQYAIETAINKSKKKILISANVLKFNIQKLIIRRNDINITIITQCEKLKKSIFKMTLHKHIDVICTSIENQTAMLFDEKNLCLIDSMSVLCSEDDEIIRQYKKNMNKILQSSIHYLK